MTRTPDANHPDETAQPTDAPPTNRTPTRADSTRRLNRWVILLLGVIISGAFAFSAETWIGLAEVVGFRFGIEMSRGTIRLAWMLPVTVDGYLCLTTWLFLSARPASPLRRYAGLSLLGVVGLSTVAQGVYHGLDARGVDIAQVWPLVVAVGALPVGVLASSVHLLSIYLHNEPEEPPATRARRRPTQRRTAERPAPRPEPARPASATAKPQRLAVVGAPTRGRAAEVDDATLADAIRDHVLNQQRRGLEPMQREMVRLVQDATGCRVGQKRCVRVAQTIREGESDADDKERESWAA